MPYLFSYPILISSYLILIYLPSRIPNTPVLRIVSCLPVQKYTPDVFPSYEQNNILKNTFSKKEILTFRWNVS